MDQAKAVVELLSSDEEEDEGDLKPAARAEPKGGGRGSAIELGSSSDGEEKPSGRSPGKLPARGGAGGTSRANPAYQKPSVNPERPPTHRELCAMATSVFPDVEPAHLAKLMKRFRPTEEYHMEAVLGNMAEKGYKKDPEYEQKR